MTIDWREELKRMEREKEILDRAFENGTLCWYREPWKEEPYPQEEMQECLEYGLWDEIDNEGNREEGRSWGEEIDEKWQDLYWDTVVRW